MINKIVPTLYLSPLWFYLQNLSLLQTWLPECCQIQVNHLIASFQIWLAYIPSYFLLTCLGYVMRGRGLIGHIYGIYGIYGNEFFTLRIFLSVFGIFCSSTGRPIDHNTFVLVKLSIYVHQALNSTDMYTHLTPSFLGLSLVEPSVS